MGVQEAFSWIAWCSILLKYWRSPGSDCTHDLNNDSPSTIHTYIVCTVGSEWCDMPISWNEKDKEFLLKIGFYMSECIHWWTTVINFNIMRYSFDTVRPGEYPSKRWQYKSKYSSRVIGRTPGLRISQNFRLDLIYT